MGRRVTAIRLGGIVILSSLLGCQWISGIRPDGQTVTVTGMVDMAALNPRSTQATIEQDIVTAATISLMDTVGASASTVATTVTKANGSFSLTIPGFKTDPAKTYILEAVKGLGNNAVNKDAVRVRTLMRYTDGWITLTNAIPNTGIVLGLGSTAVAAMYSLKYNTIDPTTLMGTVAPNTPEAAPNPPSADTYTPPGGAGYPTKQDFHTVSDLVYRSILGNTDPITGLQYDATSSVFFIKTSEDPFIDNLSSTAAGYGSPLTITGYRFDTAPLANTVFFGGATSSYTATIDTSKPNNANALYVTVPEGCPSGEVLVRNAKGTSNGINFTVIPRVGGKVSN